MKTLMFLALFASGAAWAKKPKPVALPPPEVQAAQLRYNDASYTFGTALHAASTSEIQQKVWELGDDGAAFQQRLDALKAQERALEERWMAANAAVQSAVVARDPAAVDVHADAMRAALAEVAPLAEAAGALKTEVEQALASFPSTIALADLATTSPSKLQRIFQTAGWAREGAAVGVMATSGYSYENFDVERDGKVLNVYVIRPDASATGTGGMPPKQVAAQAKPETASRYHEATDTWVEIRPGDGATPADAKALLEAVITP